MTRSGAGMRPQIVRTVSCAALAFFAAATVLAQVEQALSFDVASVRLSAPTTRRSQRITDTRVDLIRIDLRQLLWLAFEIEPLCCRDRLVAPDWLPGVAVDIQATLPAGGTRKQVPAMLRSLLMERLGLRTHVEPRPADGYELVVGSDGMRMQEVQPANELDKDFSSDASKTLSDSLNETVNGPVRTMGITLGMRTITDRTMYERRFTAQRTQRIEAARLTMAEFVSILTQNTGRPVLDRTGLTGLYRFSIELPSDAFVVPGLLAAGITTTVQGIPLTEPTGASTVKAVEELGLKLEPRRMMVDTIVVDRIERTPTDN